MKYLSIGFLLCFLLNLAYAQGGIEIKGRIEGISSGKLYLTTQTAKDKTDTLSVVDFQHETFKLKARVEYPILATLSVGGYSGGFNCFIEPNCEYEALLRNGKGWYIRGGLLQNRWTAYQDEVTSLVDSINQGRKRYEELRTKGKFRSASRLNDTLSLMTNRYEDYQKAFFMANDNVISAYLIQLQAESKNLSLEDSRKLYATLGPQARETAPALLMKQRIDRLQATVKGKRAPDFSMANVEGKVLRLHKIAAKVKIVDFWASWCAPCRLSNQHLKSIYAELAPKGLVVVGVSLDEDRGKWLNAIEKQALPWMQLCDFRAFSSDVAKLYNIKSIPALFVLDEQNNIIARDLKGEALQKFLRERLP